MKQDRANLDRCVEGIMGLISGLRGLGVELEAIVVDGDVVEGSVAIKNILGVEVIAKNEEKK